MAYNTKVDQYIERSQPFAQPILKKLRSLVHKACPQVTETIKWSMPYFEYHGLLCHMAAFNHHCAFGFWKAPLMKDAEMLIANNGKAMGHSGKIASLADLPPEKVLIERIQDAMRLNEEGVELPSRHRNKVDVAIPDSLQTALRSKRNAFHKFEEMSPSHRSEYIRWVNEAKTAETKKNRSEKVVEMILHPKK